MVLKTTTINQKVKLVCSGDRLFIIKYLGKELAIVEDENGDEKCVSINNVREEA